MIPGNANPLLLASAAADAAAAGPIKSVRFNSGDSAYLNRTPSSTGNRQTWTLSAWIKKYNTNFVPLFSVEDSAGHSSIEFNSSKIKWNTFTSANGAFETDALFRDPSAWYHVVISYDSTLATAADRIKCYVNGVEQTFSSYTAPTQNQQTPVNNTVPHTIGKTESASTYGDIGLTAVYLVDGSALAPTSFGAFDDNGVWQSAAYSGTFGTNGFHLFDFANESGIGDDSSGNNNDFTANNLVASSNNWANYVYAGGATYSSTETGKDFYTGSGDDLFDGTINNYVGAENVAEGTLYFRPETAITGVTSIQLYGAYGAETRVNGSVVTVSPAWTTSDQYVTIQSPPSSITEISVKGSSGAAARLKAIKVNGSMLTDSPAKDVDVLRDVPVNGTQSDTGAGGEVSANYPTWNPLSGQHQELSNGNLEAESGTISSYATIPSTIAMTSGKWYAEFKYIENVNAQGDGSSFFRFGISQTDRDFESGSDPLGTAKDFGFTGAGTLKARTNGSNSYTYTGNTVYDGDILSLAFDADAGKLWIAKNGIYATNSGGTGDPANGNNPDFSSLTYSGGYVFVAGPYAGAASPAQGGGRLSAKLIANWGQRSFAYAAPSGFKALCTTNLPTPTISDGSTGFDATLYTGNGSTQSISVANHSPDLVWVKSRNDTTGHRLFDTVRGDYKFLDSSSRNNETTNTNQIAITSSGFDTGASVNTNDNNDTYVAWTWDGGTSTVSNTDGSITSSVRASATNGFSIVKYVGTGANASVGHGLSAAPDWIIFKDINRNDEPWFVYHSALGSSAYLFLNTTAAQTTGQSDFMNSTDPTNSVFSLGNATGKQNRSGSNFLALCWTAVAGYSAFGEYAANGDTDGPFIHTGFAVSWLMTKRSDGTGRWEIHDYKRPGYNPQDDYLRADSTAAEASADCDFLSNGFKIRNTASGQNASGGNFIYAAFAKNPFQANGGLAR